MKKQASKTGFGGASRWMDEIGKIAFPCRPRDMGAMEREGLSKNGE